MNSLVEPVWVNGRILAFLLDACRRDHRVPRADLEEEGADRILVAPVRRWEAGERHLARLGATLFGAIERAPEAGSGRVPLATVGAFVFRDLNGLRPEHRPGVLYNVVRRAPGRRNHSDRIAQLAESRRYGHPP